MWMPSLGLASSVGKITVEALSHALPTNHPGNLTWYMDIEYKRDRENRFTELSQTRYIESVLERSDIGHSSSLPASTSMNLRSAAADKGVKDVPFREMLRYLVWIANQPRPDISSSSRAEARHLHNPKETHWKAVQKILDYLHSAVDLRLKYRAGPDADMKITVHVNAE